MIVNKTTLNEAPIGIMRATTLAKGRGLSRESRWRHLPADADALQSEIDELVRDRFECADELEKKGGKRREQFAAPREEPQVSPRIEIVFHSQEGDVFFFTPIAKLGAIGVSFPPDTAEQFPVDGTKRDEVATAAMIWAENQFPARQVIESKLDVGRAQSRTIPADCDYFLISKLGNLLDGILKARREIPPGLAVNVRPASRRISGRREQVNIHLA